MAFNITATDTTTENELLESIGSYSGFAVGIGLAVSTTLSVTVPSLKTVKGVVALGQGSDTEAHLASTSGNSFTITCGNADTIHWIAWGDPKA